MQEKKKVLLTTTGGDCPGLNAVIRGVVLSAEEAKIEVYGAAYGFEGLLLGKAPERLSAASVRSILPRSGTILGASNHSNPYNWKGRDEHLALKRRLARAGIDGMICVGGEGSLEFIQKLSADGIPAILIPKTIDNDVPVEGDAIGFWSAVDFIVESMDALRSTGESHHRPMVIEVMGRTAGYLALYSGIAGGADAILIPEIPFDLKRLAKRLARKANGSLLIAIAEGVRRSLKERDKLLHDLDALLAEPVGGSRFVRLGHLQRGCPPRAWDRLYGGLFGAYAVDLIRKNKWNRIVVNRGHDLADVGLNDADGRVRVVSALDDVVRQARGMGILFGDE